MTNTQTGELIRKLRKVKGLTLEDVADKNFTKGYISLIERGKVTPSLKALTHIAKKLETDVSKLLNNDYDSEYNIGSIEAAFNLKKYKKVVSYCKKVDTAINSPSGVKALLLKSKALFNLGQYDESIKSLMNIISNEEQWNLIYKLESYYYISRCLGEQKSYAESLEMYDKSIAFANKYHLEWHELISNMYLNKASTLQILNRYKDAISTYNKCIQYSKEHNVIEPILDSFIRIGFCYFQANNIEYAKKYALQAININEFLELELPQADISLLLSRIYLKEENLQLAEEHAEKSYKLYKKLLVGEEYIGALFTLADIYINTNRGNKAIEMLKMIDKESNNLSLSSSLIEKLANMCVDLGLSDMANVFYAKLVENLKNNE